MSDTDKITAEIKTKVKDPKRVEAGKKLAALSKAAREKKKAVQESLTERSSNWNYSVIGIVGIAVAMASLVIAYKGYSRDSEKTEKTVQKCEPEPKPAPSSVSNLENL